MERFDREPRPKNGLILVCRVLGILALVALVFGCGGGIRGTGGIDVTQVEGRIIRLDGTPFDGATITLIETGDSSISNSSGEFVIQSDLISGELSLLVVAGSANSTVPIGFVSAEAPTLRLELQVDEAKNSVIVVSRVVPTPVPTQANTSSSFSSSSPTKPDPVNILPPTPTSVVIPSPASTPTPMPSPSPAPTVRIITYSGVLKRKTSGGFIADATVRLVETGAFGTTNEQGRFNFTTPEVAGNITIEVISQGKSARATLDVGAASPIAITFEILFIIESAANPPDFSIEFSTGAPGSD